jgi:hypothetical protein
MIWGMLRDIYRMRWCDRVPVAAVLALALLASGCTGSGGVAVPTTAAPSDASAAPPPPNPPSLKDKITGFFSGASAKAPQAVANAQPDVDCPLIDIREGASTLTIPPPNGDNGAMSLKYQGTFVRAARECAVVAGQMVMKIGVEGRVIVGPAGGPGEVNVPLRIAVVDSPMAGSKMIVTKLIQIPVTIGSTDDSSTFTHIEEGLTFPLPSSASLDNYVVYIGFDPIGAEALDKPKPKAAPKIKPKPKANTPTG